MMEVEKIDEPIGVQQLTQLLQAIEDARPKRPRGFGPFREDYASDEVYDKARGPRVAL